jgi:hypothetical protein
MEHPILTRIRREGFAPLGWFAPRNDDRVPNDARFVILIGNAGPDMFRRFARERDPDKDLMDEWTKTTVDLLAHDLDAKAVYPFDQPALPFLTWARRGRAGHVSPLGLNIHSTYGLWHAFRAALLFPFEFDLPPFPQGPRPCDTCADKPCLTACPVRAFDGTRYNVGTCAEFLKTETGAACMDDGCQARRACPIGKPYEYGPAQMQFHMRAFLKARQNAET